MGRFKLQKTHGGAIASVCFAISACSYDGGSMFIFYTVLSCPPSSPVFLIHALHVYLLSCKIDGTESVGYEDDGDIGIVLLDVGEHSLFGLHIERRCCFVEQQYAAWAKYGPCYGNALCLSFRQAATRLSAKSVETMWQTGYEVSSGDV